MFVTSRLAGIWPKLCGDCEWHGGNHDDLRLRGPSVWGGTHCRWVCGPPYRLPLLRRVFLSALFMCLCRNNGLKPWPISLFALLNKVVTFCFPNVKTEISDGDILRKKIPSPAQLVWMCSAQQGQSLLCLLSWAEYLDDRRHSWPDLFVGWSDRKGLRRHSDMQTFQFLFELSANLLEAAFLSAGSGSFPLFQKIHSCSILIHFQPHRCRRCAF